MYKNEHKFPYRWTKKDANFTKDKGKVMSCFCCGGGSSFGYKLAGYDVVACNEIDPKVMSMNYCCHEASHVCDAIEEYTDLEHGGEPSAYLIGWIASCINNARLGIGDFVEIVDKEEK